MEKLAIDAVALVNREKFAQRELLSVCRAARGDFVAWHSAMFREGAKGRTAIMHAAHTGDLARLGFFLTKGAREHVRLLKEDSSGMCAYVHAAMAEQWSACALLRTSSVGLLTQNADAATRCLSAVCNSAIMDSERQKPAALAEIQALLLLGARAGDRPWWIKDSLIVKCAGAGFLGAVQELMLPRDSAPSDAQLEHAMISAANSGFAEVVEALAAEPRARNGVGEAACRAAVSGHFPIVRFLVERFAPLPSTILDSCLYSIAGDWLLDAEAIKYMLRAGANPLAVHSITGVTALTEVARSQGDREDCARVLLDAGDMAGEEPALAAAYAANPRILRLLLDSGYQPTSLQNFCMNGLLANAARGCATHSREGALELAISAVGGAQCSEQHALSAYMALFVRAPESPYYIPRALQIMLNAGLRVPHEERKELLSMATSFPAALKVLLDALHPPAEVCELALHISVCKLNIESAKMLLEAGADPNPRDSLLITCIGRPSKGDFYGMMRVLLDAGADVNCVGEETPLSCAVYEQDIKACKELLSRGAMVTAKALHSACQEYQRLPCLLLLLNSPLAQRCDVDARCAEYGETALMVAANEGNFAACKKLMEHGASREAVCNEGKGLLERVEDVARFKGMVGW